MAMPSRREENGTFRDVVHPISPEARNTMESSILEAYKRELEIRAAELELNPEPIAASESVVEGSEE